MFRALPRIYHELFMKIKRRILNKVELAFHRVSLNPSRWLSEVVQTEDQGCLQSEEDYRSIDPEIYIAQEIWGLLRDVVQGW